MYKISLQSNVRLSDGRLMIERITQEYSDAIVNEATRQFARTLVAFSQLSKDDVQSSVDGRFIEVWIDNRKYGWVSHGTNVGKPPYTIKAKPGKVLTIRGYDAGSRSGIIDTRQGRYTGDVRYASEVKHPGIAPREFDVQIHEELLNYIQSSAGKRALSKAIEESLGDKNKRTVKLRFS